MDGATSKAKQLLLICQEPSQLSSFTDAGTGETDHISETVRYTLKSFSFPLAVHLHCILSTPLVLGMAM